MRNIVKSCLKCNQEYQACHNSWNMTSVSVELCSVIISWYISSECYKLLLKSIVIRSKQCIWTEFCCCRARERVLFILWTLFREQTEQVWTLPLLFYVPSDKNLFTMLKYLISGMFTKSVHLKNRPRRRAITQLVWGNSYLHFPYTFVCLISEEEIIDVHRCPDMFGGLPLC